MTKTEFRKKHKLLRQNLTLSQIDDNSIAVSNQLLKLSIWEHSFYHVFLPITSLREVNTEHILSILSGKDKNIVISKSNFETFKMTNYLLTDATTIKLNSYGIPEPIDGIEIDPIKIDVVFIPLLAFDKQGHRVGYGKGFYDRFLAQCKPKVVKIGLSFFEAEDYIDDHNENDILLDYCITPQSIYTF